MPTPQHLAETAKVAAVETTSVEDSPEAKERPVLPQGVDLAALCRDIQTKLKEFGCYGGAVNASWGSASSGGVERFNTLANLDLDSDEPEPATLDALKDWNGTHCPVEEDCAGRAGTRRSSLREETAPPS